MRPELGSPLGIHDVHHCVVNAISIGAHVKCVTNPREKARQGCCWALALGGPLRVATARLNRCSEC